VIQDSVIFGLTNAQQNTRAYQFPWGTNGTPAKFLSESAKAEWDWCSRALNLDRTALE
jgi:hypothetical protein